MRPITLSQTGTGGSAVAQPDYLISPFAIGLGLSVSGTVNVTVQHTFDDPQAAGFSPASATWYDHPTLAAKTANADSNYAFPVRGIRINVNSGTGTATLKIVQAGGR